ncbi:MAG: hypothetical protein WBG35_00370 [Acidobacteriaceae bacterium]
MAIRSLEYKRHHRNHRDQSFLPLQLSLNNQPGIVGNILARPAGLHGYVYDVTDSLPIPRVTGALTAVTNIALDAWSVASRRSFGKPRVSTRHTSRSGAAGFDQDGLPAK